MPTTTTMPIAEPTIPTQADRAHDADVRLQKEQLALVATLLPKDSAIAEAEALGRAGRLDPAKVTLLTDLAEPLDSTTLSLPLTERAVHDILAELIAALDSEFYEKGQRIPYDEDKLSRLGGLGQAIHLMTEAKIRADMDWLHARAPMPQGGQYDPLVWELLGLLTALEPVGVLERARGRYPAHQQVIDLLVPLARHLHAQRQAGHAARGLASQQPEPSTAPSKPLRSIKPSTANRIKAMRAEFADDPDGVDFLIDLLDAAQLPAQSQETPAQPVASASA